MSFPTTTFGLRQHGAAMRGPDGRINHAVVKLGDALIMMRRPGKGYRNPKRLGQATQSLYIDVRAVDQHFERAQRGLGYPRGAGRYPVGHRRYGVTDPEGHRWYFAQALRPGKPRAKRKAQ